MEICVLGGQMWILVSITASLEWTCSTPTKPSPSPSPSMNAQILWLWGSGMTQINNSRRRQESVSTTSYSPSLGSTAILKSQCSNWVSWLVAPGRELLPSGMVLCFDPYTTSCSMGLGASLRWCSPFKLGNTGMTQLWISHRCQETTFTNTTPALSTAWSKTPFTEHKQDSKLGDLPWDAVTGWWDLTLGIS
jgi:hypothetical protein